MDILIVEDVRALRIPMASVIEDAGHSALQAEDGEKSLEILSGRMIVLIFMDINIPVIDDIEVNKNLKCDRSTSSIPIILTSAVIDNSEKHSIIKESRANAFMGKPIDNTR
jgi:sigma-B regulation protein RsbU (phosphoserine phosphatase)